MKLGMIVQRYGLDIAGGAELHCRLVAEHLSTQHSVEVFTTCAKDYVTWKNHYSAGTEELNGVRVHRFPVKRNRNIRRFEDVQNLVFHEQQSRELELRWLKENGPYCPKLISKVKHRGDIDAWILFSYRYWTTAESLRFLGKKALLVPTAEHDPALYLKVVGELFNLPAAIVYNSHEEKELIQKVSDNHEVPGDIVGVGLVESDQIKADTDQGESEFQHHVPYILYIGRIDKNKGCDHMFRMFQRYCRETDSKVNLCLIGKTVMPIPEHPQIMHLGFLSDDQKADALRRCEMLIMPSFYESLSMVLLEAWQFSRPAIVNARCEVLNGQCLRSQGGLPYRNYDEFQAALSFLLHKPEIAEKIGQSGNKYYQENYNWDTIVSKYNRLLSLVLEKLEGR